jgi:hypothetical protein
MVTSWARRVLPIVAWLFVACSIVQVFLAGLGVFENPARFAAHRDFGYTLSALFLVLIVLAIVGRMGRRVIGLTLLLLIMFLLQSVFVAFRTSQPMIAALHPVNGFLIILVGIVLAREGRRRGSATPVNRPGA